MSITFSDPEQADAILALHLTSDPSPTERMEMLLEDFMRRPTDDPDFDSALETLRVALREAL